MERLSKWIDGEVEKSTDGAMERWGEVYRQKGVEVER